jgi:hypothetical protein
MKAPFSRPIDRQVDLRTPFDLSRYFRPFTLKEARTLHAA